LGLWDLEQGAGMQRLLTRFIPLRTTKGEKQQSDCMLTKLHFTKEKTRLDAYILASCCLWMLVRRQMMRRTGLSPSPAL